MERKYLTVSALNRYLKYKFDNDINLQKILIKAEISNFKHHSRGHLYLTLKDNDSEISAIMFSSNAQRLNFRPKDGDQVIVEGHISIYEPRGSYQVYIHKMEPDGIGDLYLAYERLKEELEKLGMFKEERKLPLPKYPKTIGVITSPTGAAVRDIINVISLRYPLAKIIIYPALVQGENAKESITNQIDQANIDQLADVLIVGRGGGSIEDLWAFNEALVARAIFKSKIPIISAVGHETDFTIADFVSDVRASTPSHAAELAVPSKIDIIDSLHKSKVRLLNALVSKYEASRKMYLQFVTKDVMLNPEKIFEKSELKLIYSEDKLNAYKPKKQIEHYQETILNYNNRLSLKMEHIFRNKERDFVSLAQKLEVVDLFQNKENKFVSLAEKLELVNPLTIMKKGYTVVKQGNQIKKSVKEIEIAENVEVGFFDGILKCQVIEKEVKK